MKFSSPLIASIQSVLAAGSELEIPEAVLLTMDLPFPLQGNRQNVTVELRGVFASINTAFSLNQGASTGAQTQQLVIFDRGIYRIRVSCASVTFVGPAASSASILCAFVALGDPALNTFSRIATTGLVPLTTWIEDRADITVQFNIPGWSLIAGTFVATGVGQSIGAEYTAHVSRLL